MKREFIYERRHTAGRLEAVMLAVSVVALIGAVFALLNYGWFPSLSLLVGGSLAFAMSRLFALIGDLFALVSSQDGGAKPPATPRVHDET